MTTRTAFMQAIQAANLGYPIAWPGVNFTPPATGIWLEVSLFENDPLQPGLANDAPISERGILQVTACNRPGTGFVTLASAASAVIAAFPKGKRIEGSVKVNRTPYRMGDITDDDKLMIPVRIEYGT